MVRATPAAGVELTAWLPYLSWTARPPGRHRHAVGPVLLAVARCRWSTGSAVPWKATTGTGRVDGTGGLGAAR